MLVLNQHNAYEAAWVAGQQMVVLTGCWVHWPALCTVSRGSPTSPGMLVSASPVLSHAHFVCEIPAYHSSIQLPPKKHLNSVIYELGFALSDRQTIPLCAAAADMKLCSQICDFALDEWATVWSEGRAECQPSVKENIFIFSSKEHGM